MGKLIDHDYEIGWLQGGLSFAWDRTARDQKRS